ncbi:hypothetical protein BDP27DRAFT_1403798 [Rhodocollybia butyracea]|uniref:Uncharacterized protein n=1 Tax=Rhodocollybia butyracea TaxID=206335 RepID=A0A9P5PPA8_9AGAR|nr:hypothetical protein BDP27DRAFT_1343000 [Rhodocollybia butyracea]KAF9067523.1 hypothetical protein BDP27DRAFT_1403798 [Rhodocollybia butyracea]
MRLTVPYASVLLVASLSCIWATPIAVNRNTLIQKRSESDSSTRATTILPFEPRSLGFNGLSARARSTSSETGSYREEANIASSKSVEKLKERELIAFTFTTPVTLRKGNRPEEEMGAIMATKVKNLFERAYPDIKIKEGFHWKVDPKARRHAKEEQADDVTFECHIRGDIDPHSGILRHADRGLRGKDYLFKAGKLVYPKGRS